MIKVQIKYKVMSKEAEEKLEQAEAEYKYNKEEGNDFLNEGKEVLINESDYITHWVEGRLREDLIATYYDKSESPNEVLVFYEDGETFIVKGKVTDLDKYFDIK
jgi:hypothetical protein